MNFLKQKIGAICILSLAVLKLSAQSAAQFSNLPIWFEASQPTKFVAHASGSEFAISAAGAEFTLTKSSGETAGCQLRFVGANPVAHISGDQKLTGTINYLLGNDSSQWRSGVPTFAQVRVKNIYSGINVVYYGNHQQLEYDFDLAAGVNPSVIALRFDGAKKISVNAQGELVIGFKSGEVVQHAPVAYQTIDGVRQEIIASYKIINAHTAAFALGNYNKNEPLVIDPVLTYSSFFGGNNGATGWAIAVDPADGSIFVAGQTSSTKDGNNVPPTFSTPGAFQTNYHGGALTGDAFVAKFLVNVTVTNNTVTNLAYCTYLGGSGNDGALGLAVTNGYAFVTGFTDSPNFPTTNALYGHVGGPINPHTHTYPVDAFVTELNTNGSSLIYSTYLGGESMDAGYGIALDEFGDAFVTGYTYSTNFPVTASAFQKHLMCVNTVYLNANAFVAEISPLGTNLNYSTYLGGTNFDEARAIACNNGRIFVTGRTHSTNFPSINAIAGMSQLDGATKKLTHSADAFVTAFASSVTNLSVLYSTFLGGTNFDEATSIAATSDGTAYVAGFTTSTNFPNSATNIPHLNVPYLSHTVLLGITNTAVVISTNAFLTQIKWDGTSASIGYSAVFGGAGKDVANGVALDPMGNAYVVGTTTSTNFPVTTNNIYTNNVSGRLNIKNNAGAFSQGSSDAFIIAFNTNCSALLYSAYLGGKGNDFGNAIAVDAGGNAYVIGRTASTNFPVVHAMQSRRTGTNDMFIAIIHGDISSDDLSSDIAPVPTLLMASENDSVSPVSSKIASPFSPQRPSLALKWQTTEANSNCLLESSTDLTSNSWRTVSSRPVYSNGWFNVTLPTTNGIQFFRLHQR